MMLFSVRTVMSVCALEISKEFNYDKTQIVNIFLSVHCLIFVFDDSLKLK
jgi:hypothetical protein